ncbi:MAG TPA: DUF2911 domain-containing protein [Blastocatellia bacterium]|jgi:hypothetical protein|nr:DUF2911 domain-containing protein [Blastocatellia bacterium]
MKITISILTATIVLLSIACSGSSSNKSNSNANLNSGSSNNANAAGSAATTAPDRGQSDITIDGAKVTVEYGRPALKGRDLEAMISPGQEWRMGSNAPTTLTTGVGLKFGDKIINTGRYILKAKLVEPQKWALLIQSEDNATVAEVPMAFQKVDNTAELLTINLENRGDGGRLIVHWGNLTLSADFEKAQPGGVIGQSG